MRLPDDIQYEIERYWIAEHKKCSEDTLKYISCSLNNDKLSKEFCSDMFDFCLGMDDYDCLHNVMIDGDIMLKINTNDIQLDICGYIVVNENQTLFKVLSNPTKYDLISSLICIYELYKEILIEADAIEPDSELYLFGWLASICMKKIKDDPLLDVYELEWFIVT